jgi:MerR family transcriptional regulator, light-induced transcriptional regulator
MECTSQAVSLGGRVLGVRRHVCALFQSREEEYRVLMPFVKEGLARGEKAIHIVDPALRGDHLARLAAGGVDVARALAERQLEVPDWRETYLRNGDFDRRSMTALVESLLEQARCEGFPRSRVVGHMEWALDDGCEPSRLVEYEARINDSLQGFDDPVVCVYDRPRFAAGVAMDVLRAHPMVILHGGLQENPSFLPPETLVPRLRRRSVSRVLDRYLAALLVGAGREALELLVEDALAEGVPVPSLYVEVVQPAQYEIGRLWKEGRITVAQEHLATDVARSALGLLQAHLPSEPSNGTQVVVGCVEGEHHDLGARMVADLLAMAGFDVHFLGANVPARDVVDFVESRAPRLLALSATVGAGIGRLRETIAAVRRAAARRVHIAVGGQLLLRRPKLIRSLGGDVYARDAREMVAVARRIRG